MRIRFAPIPWISLAGFAAFAFSAQSGHASIRQSSMRSMTALKQVQIGSGADVELLFDGKISRGQIRTEFFNDVIQINLTDVSVYPAKISSVSGGALTKIFAYQYAPRLVRCRLSVKGRAEDYRSRLVIEPSGKTLSIRLVEAKSDRVTMTAAQAARAEAPRAETAVAEPAINQAEERALLERVMKSTPGAPAPQGAAAVKAAPAKTAPIAGESKSANRVQPLATGQGVPNPLSAFLKLICVTGLFVAVAMGLKRAVTGRGGQSKVFGAIRRFAQKSGLGASAKMIQVVSTHYLGPKKSIAVVRVAGRMLVLGISAESINLIAQLPDTAEGEITEPGEAAAYGDFDESPAPQGASASPAGLGTGDGAVAAGPAIFSDLLKAARTPEIGGGNAAGGARARIRSRLEGLKPL